MDSFSDPVEPSHPKRPRRLPMIYDGLDPFYFITFNTYNRASMLNRPEVYQAFVDFCETARGFHILVGKYVLMPDHIHLLVVMPTRSGQSLNAWIKAMKSVLGKALLASGVGKPHWQEGFFDHVLRSKEIHHDKGDYISQNPVRVGLCRHPEDWPYQGEIIVL